MRDFNKARCVRGQLARNGVFVRPVAGGEDLWGCVLAAQKVDNVQKPLKIAVLEIFANGDEESRHARRNSDRVLYVKVLLRTISVVI
jgi:hypothetical protein